MKKLLSILLLLITYCVLRIQPTLAVESPPLQPQPTTQPTPNNSAGINIDPTNPGGRPSASDLQVLGAHWVRFVYKANSGFDYASYVHGLNQAGIQVTLILNQETLWPGSGINTNYINQFAQNATQIASQFGNQVSAYEIWNEQDVSGQPTSMYIPPQTYAALLTATYNAIKTEDNALRVISGGLASGNLNYLQQVIQAAGGLPADGVGLHPYLTNIGQIQQLITNFLAISLNKPIWVTEVGWQVPDQQQQANFLRDFYQLVAQFGNQVSTAMWYSWSDLMNPGFGLVDANGNPKLAFLSFQQYAALIQALLPNFPFAFFATPSAYGTCQAQLPFSGGAETKGESFIYQANCLTSAQGAVDAVIKTLKLDLANNQNIADELKEPLDKLKPYNYNPLVSEKTALGKITFDVCEEGTTNWYAVEKEVEFKTPAWVQKMTTEGKELAGWLAPGGGLGSVMGEQTNNLQPITDNQLAANVVPQTGGYDCSRPFYIAIENISYNGSQIDYGVRLTLNSGDGWQCHLEVNGHYNGGCINPNGSTYFQSGASSGLVNPVPAPSDGTYQINASARLDAHKPCGDKASASTGCQVTIAGGQITQITCGGVVQPTPTPKICKRYTPAGDTVAPESVCVGGNCLVKGLSALQQIQQMVGGILTWVCKGKTFIITPKVRTPFVQSADTFLRQQTLSIFKVPSADAQDAFTFEHALEGAQHETQFSPPTDFSSETEIYGQRGVKDSYDWVQKALMPPGYSQ